MTGRTEKTVNDTAVDGTSVYRTAVNGTSASRIGGGV
jgi:hypothetical protein